MLNKKLQADHWNEICYQLLKLMIKQLKNLGRIKFNAAKVEVVAQLIARKIATVESSTVRKKDKDEDCISRLLTIEYG
ncbi:hypothetical protein Tco_0199021 [Tanacetum coccineum]